MKVYSIKIEQTSILIFVVIILSCLFYTYKNENSVTAMMPTNNKTIIIDAGHGGWDPGKIGNTGDNEKVINLNITLKLQQYLEQSGANVVVTRNIDEALGKKKKEDMNERKKIAEENEGDILVSIHQNSFPSQRAKGAQVFYYEGSENSEKLAQCVQNSFKENVDNENIREAKPNTSYYILKKISIPAIIVECGFLSNADEEKKLNTEEYQEKIAWAIYSGIINYFEEEDEKIVKN